jgi:hypothetical protein
MNKYKQRWDKLKETAKKKKESSGAIVFSTNDDLVHNEFRNEEDDEGIESGERFLGLGINRKDQSGSISSSYPIHSTFDHPQGTENEGNDEQKSVTFVVKTGTTTQPTSRPSSASQPSPKLPMNESVVTTQSSSPSMYYSVQEN